MTSSFALETVPSVLKELPQPSFLENVVLLADLPAPLATPFVEILKSALVSPDTNLNVLTHLSLQSLFLENQMLLSNLLEIWISLISEPSSENLSPDGAKDPRTLMLVFPS